MKLLTGNAVSVLGPSLKRDSSVAVWDSGKRPQDATFWRIGHDVFQKSERCAVFDQRGFVEALALEAVSLVVARAKAAGLSAARTTIDGAKLIHGWILANSER